MPFGRGRVWRQRNGSGVSGRGGERRGRRRDEAEPDGCGWTLRVVDGGTSAGAPQWAVLFAIANSMGAAVGESPVSLIDSDLYETAANGYAASFHDVIMKL